MQMTQILQFKSFFADQRLYFQMCEWTYFKYSTPKLIM